MPMYLVTVGELVQTTYRVEGQDEEDARDKADTLTGCVVVSRRVKAWEIESVDEEGVGGGGASNVLQGPGAVESRSEA